jgi:hypothetical protein
MDGRHPPARQRTATGGCLAAAADLRHDREARLVGASRRWRRAVYAIALACREARRRRRSDMLGSWRRGAVRKPGGRKPSGSEERSRWRAGWSWLYQMSSRDFEMFLAEVFRTKGCTARVTGASGDQGVENPAPICFRRRCSTRSMSRQRSQETPPALRLVMVDGDTFLRGSPMQIVRVRRSTLSRYCPTLATRIQPLSHGPRRILASGRWGEVRNADLLPAKPTPRVTMAGRNGRRRPARAKARG